VAVPRFGSHLSVAGGVHKAVESAVRLGCEALQVFTKNASQWAAPPIPDDEVRRFRRALRGSGVRSLLAHDSYLINLGSPEDALFAKSVDALVDEVQRADRLGLHYLVAHPGAHLGSGEAAGLDRIAAGLDEVHRRTPTAKAMILLETTAGQGTTLGHRFEHLAGILAKVADPGRLGVCFDTCHVFAAGYELSPAASYRATFREFDRVVGLRHLRAFHVNDSLKPRGSRVDRHAHIGQGELGPEPFRLLVNDHRFRAKPMVLETAKTDDAGRDMDAVNLALLREMAGEAPAAPTGDGAGDAASA
jgi:deoxyribonuclease-4